MEKINCIVSQREGNIEDELFYAKSTQMMGPRILLRQILKIKHELIAVCRCKYELGLLGVLKLAEAMLLLTLAY